MDISSMLFDYVVLGTGGVMVEHEPITWKSETALRCESFALGLKSTAPPCSFKFQHRQGQVEYLTLRGWMQEKPWED